MADQLADRSRLFVQIAALVYVVVAVPLLSVSAVLPTISPFEAAGTVVLAPPAIFAFLFIVLFIIQSTILLLVLLLYANLAFVCTFLGGQPVPQLVHIWLSKATRGWHTTIRHYRLYDRQQGSNYLSLVLLLSTAFAGLRLLEAFREVRP